MDKDKIKEMIEKINKMELLGEVDYSRIKFATAVLEELLEKE